MRNEYKKITSKFLFHLQLLILFLFFSTPYSAKEPWEWHQEEVNRYFAGWNEIYMNGWGRLNDKVNKIVRKLVNDTGKVFRVVPGQTFQVGQAHVGGWIILDLSTATKNEDVLAFWLAHEWAHEHLGHVPNLYKPHGKNWTYRKSSTADEDEADEWAGGFLARNGYSLDNVVNELKSLPNSPADKTHSDGLTRAKTVIAAYKKESPDCQLVTRECDHPVHINGDALPCTHPAHYNGDIMQCQHACQSYYGIIPCHPMGDIFPCQHPAHEFDLIPCSHLAHPEGHSEKVCQ